jgi:hypothetical protein
MIFETILIVITGVVGALFASSLGSWTDTVAQRLVRSAGQALPVDKQASYQKEFEADMVAIGTSQRRFLFALQLFQGRRSLARNLTSEAPVQKVAPKQAARQALRVAITVLSAVIGLSFLGLAVLLISRLSGTDFATPVILGLLTALLVGAILSSGLWVVGAFSNNYTESIIGKQGFLFTTVGIALFGLAYLLGRYLL